MTSYRDRMNAGVYDGKPGAEAKAQKKASTRAAKSTKAKRSSK